MAEFKDSYELKVSIDNLDELKKLVAQLETLGNQFINAAEKLKEIKVSIAEVEKGA